MLSLLFLAQAGFSGRAAAGVNLQGDWRMALSHSSLPAFECAATIVQSEQDLYMSATCPKFSITPKLAGTIDQSTGAFDFPQAEGWPGMGLTGQSSLDGSVRGTWSISGISGIGEFTGARTTLQLGDANCDGAVDSVDALLVVKHVDSAYVLPCKPFADSDLNGKVNKIDAAAILGKGARIYGFSNIVGDVTCDGILNSLDALAALQLEAGLESPFTWLPCSYLRIDAQEILQYVADIPFRCIIDPSSC